MSVTKIAVQTETKPMSKTNVGANLVFALRTITRNEPMTENHTFVSRHRFDSGYCLEGEHKVRPYIDFAHRLGFGLPAILVTLNPFVLEPYCKLTIRFIMVRT